MLTATDPRHPGGEEKNRNIDAVYDPEDSESKKILPDYHFVRLFIPALRNHCVRKIRIV
jgi:hypothetical protein